MNTDTMMDRYNAVYDDISSLYHKASEKLGLSDSVMLILYLLSEYGETLSQSEITNITGMSKQTVSSAVGRMEKSGWMRRGERSGRRQNLVLTDSGRQIIRDVIEPFRTVEESIFADWTPEEKETYLRLNRKYRDALRKIVENLPVRRQG